MLFGALLGNALLRLLSANGNLRRMYFGRGISQVIARVVGQRSKKYVFTPSRCKNRLIEMSRSVPDFFSIYSASRCTRAASIFSRVRKPTRRPDRRINRSGRNATKMVTRLPIVIGRLNPRARLEHAFHKIRDHLAREHRRKNILPTPRFLF